MDTTSPEQPSTRVATALGRWALLTTVLSPGIVLTSSTSPALRP